METNIVLCVLVGLPGSGKTTLASEIRLRIPSVSNISPLEVILFSFDDFLSLQNQEKLVLESRNNVGYKPFKENRSEFVKSVVDEISVIRAGKETDGSQRYFKEKDSNINQKYILILDDNFYYKSMRYKIFQVASEYNCGFCQVFLECSSAVAMARNKDRVGRVPREAILAMEKKLEPPSCANGWERESLTVQCHSVDSCFKDICELILNNFHKGLSFPDDDSEDRKAAQSRNLTSLLHRADLTLRLLVRDKVKHLKETEPDNTRDSVKAKAAAANKTRKDLISELREQRLLVPKVAILGSEINQVELDNFLKEEFKNSCSF